MTLVVTAASLHGLTVLADRRFSRTRRLSNGQELTEPRYARKKIFFNPDTRIAMAIWGWDGRVVDRKQSNGRPASLRRIVRDFCQRIKIECTVKDAAYGLAEKLNSLYVSPGHGLEHRRGVHVSGFENESPAVYHVHSGHPYTGYTEDFNVTADSDEFKDSLNSGKCCAIVGGITDFYLSQRRGVPLPFNAPSLWMQEISLRMNFLQIYEEISSLDPRYAPLVGDAIDVLSFNKSREVNTKYEQWSQFLASVPQTPIEGRAVVGTTLAISPSSMHSLFTSSYRPTSKK